MPTLELFFSHLGTWNGTKHHLVSAIGTCGNYHHPLAEALMALVFGFEGPEAKSGQPSPGKCRPVFAGSFLVREFRIPIPTCPKHVGWFHFV